MNRQRFVPFAWGVVIYNLFVILWGAFVRATGSGAGCGRHWPTCNGAIVPRAPAVETLIEFAHRLTSGLAGILVILLVIWAFRAFRKGHPVRRAAPVSLLLILVEGALGAGLVLRELVALNDSVERAIWVAGHLTNTFLLLGALTLTAWWGTTLSPDHRGRALRLQGQGKALWLLGIALLLVTVVSAAGAVTALGDTLFPSATLADGVARDFSPTAHFLERLRIWHPVLAVLTALYTFTVVGLLREWQPGRRVRRQARVVQSLFFVQIVAGGVNLLLLAPVWMQLVHLLLADTIWIALVVLAATVLAEEAPALKARAGERQAAPSFGGD